MAVSRDWRCAEQGEGGAVRELLRFARGCLLVRLLFLGGADIEDRRTCLWVLLPGKVLVLGECDRWKREVGSVSVWSGGAGTVVTEVSGAFSVGGSERNVILLRLLVGAKMGSIPEGFGFAGSVISCCG